MVENKIEIQRVFSMLADARAESETESRVSLLSFQVNFHFSYDLQ